MSVVRSQNDLRRKKSYGEGFEDYLCLADQAAQQYRRFLPNHIDREDLKMVAQAAIWEHHKSLNGNAAQAAEEDFHKVARKAIRAYLNANRTRVSVWSMDASQEEGRWEGKWEEEPPSIPNEEIKTWPISGPRLYAKVKNAVPLLPHRHQEIIRQLYWFHKTPQEVSATRGWSLRSVQYQEDQALRAMRRAVDPNREGRLAEAEGSTVERCVLCEEEKEITAFHFRPHGRDTTCKECRRAIADKREKEKRIQNHQRLLVQHPPDTTKLCEICEVEKPLYDFRPDKRYRKGPFAGFDVLCATCRTAYPKAMLRKRSQLVKARREKPKNFCAKGGRCWGYRFYGHPVELPAIYKSSLCPGCEARELGEK